MQILQSLVASFTSLGTSALPDRFKIACRLNPAALDMIWLVTHLPYSHTHRQHLYNVYFASLVGVACVWLDGLPCVQAYTGDERSVFIRTSADYIEPSAEQGSHHAARIRSYLSASPVMVVTEHFVLVRRRHVVACPAEPVGIKGIIAEGLLRALMIYLLQLASYSLAEIVLSIPPDDGWRKRETLNKATPHPSLPCCQFCS